MADPVVRAGVRGPGLSLPETERLWRLGPVGVGLLSLVLGLVEETKQPIWFDEQVTIGTATRSLSGIWRAARETEAPHLVYYLLMKPWLAAAGTSLWVARLPAVVFAALAAAVLTALGTRLLGRPAGLVAGAILATSAFVVHWSQQARGYTLAMLLVVVAAYALVRAIDEPRARWWALWAVAAAAAAWVNVLAASALLAQLAAFAAVRPRPPLRAPAIAAAAALAASMPIGVLVATGNNGQLDWIPAPTLRRLGVQTWDWSSRNPFLLLAAAVGSFALAAAVPRLVERWRAVLVCSWAVAPFVTTLALSAIQPAFEARYLLSAAPALALLVGACAAFLPPRPAIVLVALAFAGAGVQLAHLYVAPGKPLSALF